jgi:TRAP-type C4-dicarboxylate transport system permease small subunit
MYPAFMKLSRFMAYLGGIMLSGLILLTCLSVLGRSLNGMLHSDFIEGIAPGFAQWAINLGIGPINGDFELIEAGIAFAIFAFMPLCTLSGGHASVDIFTQGMSDRVNRILRLITSLLFAAVFVLIATQLFGGLQTKFRSGQTTFLLEFPLWWAYALSMFAAAVAAVVAVYIAVMRVLETLSGHELLPSETGADH